MDRQVGSSCMIVGTAPSINDLPLERASGTDTFFLNKAYTLTGRIKAPKSYLVLSDPLAFEDYGASIPFESFDINFFTPEIPYSASNATIARFNVYRRPRIDDGHAQHRLDRPLYHAHTVAAYAVQIAVAMGYQRITLIGIDFSFGQGDGHFYRDSEREKTWTRNISVPKAPRMLKAFSYLADWTASRQVRLENASPLRSLPNVRNIAFEERFPVPVSDSPGNSKGS